MSIHTQKQHFTICLLRKKNSIFVNETKALNFSVFCASKHFIFLLQQLFTVKTASSSAFVTTRAEICALLFMGKNVYNANNVDFRYGWILGPRSELGYV